MTVFGSIFYSKLGHQKLPISFDDTSFSITVNLEAITNHDSHKSAERWLG